jgi:hypothetical protein
LEVFLSFHVKLAQMALVAVSLLAFGQAQEAQPSSQPGASAITNAPPAAPLPATVQPDVVTNQTVLDMVNAKLPSDVIITKI